jgi:hypothetical protein
MSVHDRTGTESSSRKDLVEHIDSTSRGNHWFDLGSYKMDRFFESILRESLDICKCRLPHWICWLIKDFAALLHVVPISSP